MRSIEIAKDVNMPILGLGTWELRDRKVLKAVIDAALDSGYRFFDSAQSYGNEKDIGEILKELLPKYKLERKDVFITTKLNTRNQGKEKAREAGLKSKENFGFDYIDLLLIHFPGTSGIDVKDEANRVKRTESWLELEKLKSEGVFRAIGVSMERHLDQMRFYAAHLVQDFRWIPALNRLDIHRSLPVLGEGVFRAIGVSNYMERHLDQMRAYAAQMPAVNQVEFHPHLVNLPLVKHCQELGVHFQAYSSLGSAHSSKALFKESLVTEFARKYNCSESQVLLAWAISQGVSVLPKTTNPDHVRDNIKACDVEMDQADVAKLIQLGGSNKRYCWDPTVVV